MVEGSASRVNLARAHDSLLICQSEVDLLNPFSRRFYRSSNNLLCVRYAYEAGFELLWRQVDSLVQHGMKEPAIELPVAAVRRLPIKNRPFCKERGKHRTHSICNSGHSCNARSCRHSFTELCRGEFQSFIDRGIAQPPECYQSCSHRERIPGHCSGLI